MHDRLGSVRQIFNADGDVVNYYFYDPWGKLDTAISNSTVTNIYRFAGYAEDAILGQYHCNARQYDPVLGVFTAIDPVRGGFKEPLTLHPYLYCINDPINILDPTGESPLLDLLWSSKISRTLRGAMAGVSMRVWAFAGRLYAAAYVKAVEVSMALSGASYGTYRTVNANKLNHIFDAKHNLDPILKLCNGSKELAYRVLEASLNQAMMSGVYAGQDPTKQGIVVSIGGTLVVVRGNLVDGVWQIGTCFIP